MALVTHVPLVPVADYLTGLDKSRKAVFQLSTSSANGGGKSSGWLITDSLAVAPDYAIDGSGRFECCFSSVEEGRTSAEEAVEAVLIDEAPSHVSDGGAVLLRLSRSLSDRSLAVVEKRPEAGDQVAVLQYGGGESPLSISIGRILRFEDDRMYYDANTMPGSGGSPVFDLDWNLLGMHLGGDLKRGENYGSLLNLVLRQLSGSRAWTEILRHHNLADPAAAERALGRPTASEPAAPKSALRSALLWRFAPTEFDADSVIWLEKRILASTRKSDQWILLPDERAKLLRRAGSIDALRQARARRPGEQATDPGQRTIDRILEGPPFDLASIPSAELGHWLQAVRWFAGVVPGLPTPSSVNRESGRRGVTERLQQLVGPSFRGRAAELGRLREWYLEGGRPIVVSGNGGIGKSSLVAKFAQEILESQGLVLWLDFDRADLAPDDGESVLRVLGEQAALQIDGFPSRSTESWVQATGDFAQTLAQRTNGRPPLVVLDGFEVAMHVRKHSELWTIIESLLAVAPQPRILISGRSPYSEELLAGRPAAHLPVDGLNSKDAADWLRESGIPDGPAQARVLSVSERVPLFLRIAIKLASDGVPAERLLFELPRVMKEEYLDSRVIERLLDPSIRLIARGVLVLRRVTQEIIAPVLGELLNDLGPADAFERLAQEWAIVDRTSSQTMELVVRPNVRATTLKLLELDSPELVREVDRKAAEWYSAQNQDDPATAAETVYHLLRLGRTEDAKSYWRPGCASRLLFAGQDLPADSAARTWLESALGQSIRVGDELEDWEADALPRLLDSLRRGRISFAASILDERRDRTPQSPLAIYDAYVRVLDDDLAGALDALGPAPDVGGDIGRDRALLAALIQWRTEDRGQADRNLRSIQDQKRWYGVADWPLKILGLRAARIRLTVDLDAELRLLNLLNSDLAGEIEARSWLSPADVVLPDLARALRFGGGLESIVSSTVVVVPRSMHDMVLFENAIGRYRHRQTDESLSTPTTAQTAIIPETIAADASGDWPDDTGIRFQNTPALLGRYLRGLGHRRWGLVQSDLFIANAMDPFIATATPSFVGDTPVAFAAALSLAVFLNMDVDGYTISHANSLSLKDLIGNVSAWAAYRRLVYSGRVELAARIVAAHQTRALLRESGREVSRAMEILDSSLRKWREHAAYVELPSEVGRYLLHRHWELNHLCHYLLGPDPLETLVRQSLQLPDGSPL